MGTGARGPRAIHTPAHPVAAAPAGAASLAATVEQQTGEKPSQLSTRSVCGKPSAGRVGCLAEVLVSARTQDPVTPRVARASSGTHLQAARGVAPSVSAGATPAAESAATAPPPGTPAFLQQAYDLGFLSSTDGVGDTIAIVDSFDDPTSASDMQTFRTRFGLPGCGVSNDCFTRVNQSGQTSEYPPADPTGGWEVEESLDLDAASALCPLCHIVLVEANSISVSDVQAAAQTAAMMGANQISMSLGSAGASEPPGPWAFPGISSLAATGDSGYDGPGKIDFPAGDPGVTAVGGTDLTAAGNARGFAESAWEKAGSGCNPAITIPSYQAGTGACMGRSAADVSAVAGGADLDVYDSTPFRGSSGWIVVGGTSLATPLTAAFEALTGIDSANSPSWTYLHADLLNDITSGNNDTASGDLGGACAGGIVYICAARPGYDGPTGNGSINGDVVTGAPGIGGTYTSSVAATTAVAAGGVYPNSEDTVYRFEYGSTTSYGQQTTGQDIGSGAALVPVAATITGLTPGTAYHYRLVATNLKGTEFGYDETFTTARIPAITGPPTISTIVPQVDVPIRAQPGAWNPTGAASYQWQDCTTSDGNSCTNITGATSSSYVPTSADVGLSPRVAVTESNSFGSATAFSATIGPVAGPPAPALAPPPSRTTSTTSTSPAPSPPSSDFSPQLGANEGTTRPKITAAPRLKGNPVVGSMVRLHGGRYTGGSLTSVSFYRCAHKCSLVRSSRSPSYRLSERVERDFVRARVTVSGKGGTVSAWATGKLGPVHRRR